MCQFELLLRFFFRFCRRRWNKRFTCPLPLPLTSTFYPVWYKFEVVCLSVWLFQFEFEFEYVWQTVWFVAWSVMVSSALAADDCRWESISLSLSFACWDLIWLFFSLLFSLSFPVDNLFSGYFCPATAAAADAAQLPSASSSEPLKVCWAVLSFLLQTTTATIN